MTGPVPQHHLTVTHISGDAYVADVRGHRLLVDRVTDSSADRS
ncbi:hypothetical protein ABZ901_30980 [Actinacidiphila alni]